MENGTPPSTRQLLNRLGELEKKAYPVGCRKHPPQVRIRPQGQDHRRPPTASLRVQLQFELDQPLLGKGAPPPDPCSEISVPEEGNSNAAKPRRTNADHFPKHLKIPVDGITIPNEVLANTDDWNEIGEEHYDELDVIKAKIFWRRVIRKKFVHNPQAEEAWMSQFDQPVAYKPVLMLVAAGIGFLG